MANRCSRDRTSIGRINHSVPPHPQGGITSFGLANLRNLYLRERLSAGMIRYRIGFRIWRLSTKASRLIIKAIGVTILDCASPNTNKGHNIMGHDVVYKEQILPIAQDPFENVTTVLICQNVLLRAGLRHISPEPASLPPTTSAKTKGLRLRRQGARPRRHLRGLDAGALCGLDTGTEGALPFGARRPSHRYHRS